MSAASSRPASTRGHRASETTYSGSPRRSGTGGGSLPGNWQGTAMRVVSERQLAIVLGALAGTPRGGARGKFAPPWRTAAGHAAALPPELLSLPPVAGARAAGQRPATGCRAGTDLGAVGRHCVARYRGERASRGDRGCPDPWRASDRAAQSAGSAHLRGFG